MALDLYARLLDLSIKELRGKTILDIGSGVSEKFSKEACAQGIKVVSLNPALAVEGRREEALLPLKRKLLKKIPWQKRSVAALGQQLPFRDESFDAVTSLFGALFYVVRSSDGAPLHNEVAMILKEAVRILKPGGKAYFYPLPRRLSVTDLQAILEQLPDTITTQIAKDEVFDKTRFILTKNNQSKS